MSTVDELLAYVGVVEASGEFKVNLSARKIEVPESAGVLGVTSDECVRPVTFRIPRWYFETDLAAFDWSVNYRNAAGETARALMRVEDVDDSEFSFEWLIPRHACAQDGKVSFALCGILHGDDGASIAQEWNTVPAEFTVPQGLESDVTEEELRLDWVWKVVADCEAATDEARRAAGEVADEAKSALRQLQSVMHLSLIHI